MKPLLSLLVIGACIQAGTGWAITDCSHPKTNVDRLLCSNDKLALADHVMALAFRDALSRSLDRREALIAEQERWRKEVRDLCNDVPCLMRAYQDRTSELETW